MKRIRAYFDNRKKAQEAEKKQKAEDQQTLAALKVALKKACTIPVEFKCLQTGDWLIEPVIIPCGHCFNKSVIDARLKDNPPACPAEHKEEQFFTRDEIIENKYLKQFVNEFKKEYETVISHIEALSSLKPEKVAILRGRVEAFQALATLKAKKFIEYKKLVNEKRELLLEIKSVYDDIPDDFKCAVFTMDLFVDPVITKHGEMFEREGITEWVRDHRSSPLSR